MRNSMQTERLLTCTQVGTYKHWSELPRDADGRLQWKTPSPQPDRPVTPLKGILKNNDSPREGSAQEALAQQLITRSGVLRDASEVLAEMKQRKRKNTDSSSVSTLTCMTSQFADVIVPNAKEEEGQSAHPKVRLQEEG